MNRRFESSVQLIERYMRVYSRASSRVVSIIPSVQLLLTKTNVLCFLGMAYADIPLPKEYEVLFNYLNPSEHIVIPITITFAVLTIDTNLVVPELPDGAFTLALLSFLDEVPPLLLEIPESDYRQRGDKLLAVSIYNTWKAFADDLHT